MVALSFYHIGGELLETFLILLPAYVANPTAVVFGGSTPIDFGKCWRDGKRILGDGKTWRGLFGGTLSGGLIGLIMITIYSYFSPSFTIREAYGGWPEFIFMSFWIAFGGMFGDMLGSFIKRRRGLKRGEKAPGLDQWDFIIGAFILLLPFPSFLRTNFYDSYSIAGLMLLLILTPAIHRAVNILGYKLGVKKEPW
ncbi:MAG: CDP-2,3-bis-(O-geranylgeranyl)-sn-glycerol synthase [Thermoplasmata archaeon]|nr:MAG: CDP-2,3-bis-(O-geranylgeranyl)-sn-glycerol synthase [Thermoplasmata archaeon]